MSSDLEQKIAANITCSICLEIFSRPLTLIPCLHSYCKNCLELYVKNFTDENGCFPCPECRVQIILPLEGVEGFTHNHTLQSILDNLFLHDNSNKEKAVEIEQQGPGAKVNESDYIGLSSYIVVDTDEKSQQQKNKHTQKQQQHFNTDTNTISVTISSLLCLIFWNILFSRRFIYTLKVKKLVKVKNTYTRWSGLELSVGKWLVIQRHI